MALSLVLGEAGFVLATYASYARHDTRSPFRAMVIRTGVSLGGMVIAFLLADLVWVRRSTVVMRRSYCLKLFRAVSRRISFSKLPNAWVWYYYWA